MRDADVPDVTMADTHQAIGIASTELVRRLAGKDNERAVQAHSDRYDALRDLLNVAMNKFRLDPARTVSIGDTVWDVQASHDADVTSVAFTCGAIPRCQLEEAGADEIYRGPSDLLARWSTSRLSTLRDDLGADRRR